MKIIALDIGDRWTGIALSDPLGMFARPYDTAKTTELTSYLSTLIAKESISIIVVGLPITLRGTESDQTKKVKAITHALEKQFDTIEFILWDERLTSKQAARIQPTKTKEAKLRSHAIAAALILTSYLDYRLLHANQ